MEKNVKSLKKRMAELMIPIDNQIMMCDNREELMLLASAMLSSSRQIFLTTLGPQATIILFQEVVGLLEIEKPALIVKKKKDDTDKHKKKGSDF